MSTCRLRRILLAVVALGAFAPLGACIVSGGDGSPSSLLGNDRPHGSGTAGTWSGSSAGGSGGSHRDGGAPDAASIDGAATPAACTTGATAAFALAWTVTGAAPTDGGAAGTEGGATDASPASSDGGGAGAAGVPSDAGAASDGAGASDAGAASDGADTANAGTAACAAAGGKTVDVDVVNLVTGAESGTTVACDKLALTTCPLPRGSYSISLGLRDATGALVSEIIAPELVVENGQTPSVGPLPFEAGGVAATMARGFALTWSIEDATSGVGRTCAQAGAATVRVDASGKLFDLPCAPGAGRTPALSAGEYAVKLSLLNASGAPLSTTGSMILRLKNGQLIFLGNAVFDVI